MQSRMASRSAGAIFDSAADSRPKQASVNSSSVPSSGRLPTTEMTLRRKSMLLASRDCGGRDDPLCSR